MADDEVLAVILAMPDESIYDEAGRLAQPDEVWNYGRGDGAEKAVLLANILKDRTPGISAKIEVGPGRAVLTMNERRYEFVSAKGLGEQVWEI